MKSPTYLIPGLRTPFCKVDGPLKSLDTIQMSVPVAQAMATQVDRADLMIWGTVIPSLRWSNLAREVLLDAKLDATTPAYSTVQACSTSMVGVFEAAGMLNDHTQLAMVGGVEAMSRVQIGLTQGMSDWLRAVMQAKTFGQRLDALTGITLGLDIPSVKNRVTGKSMGEHCEEMAQLWQIKRDAQDRIAFESHKRAVAAMSAGFFDDLVISVNSTSKDGIPRPDTSMERLSMLKPAFDRSGAGTITAGNASPLTDGAAAIWVANETGMKRITGNANIRNTVKLLDYEIAGVDIFKEGLLMAPAYAIPRLLARNNLRLDGIDLWEIHEAFAAQVLCNVTAIENDAFVREKAGVNHDLGKFPWERLNPNGGSVAIGHPFGATGARILSQAAKELAAMGPGKRAVVSICADGGLGTVALLES
ncbi:MAG: acetyl-CoA C-acyltransferase [Burkholderiales bacterium]|nr:acetyl-CoA C-acyltransferase [Burkholderiales bacterium]